MKSNHTKGEVSFASKLASRGGEMDEGIGDVQKTLVREFPKASYFNLAVANAFTWTGHAIPRKGYYPAVLKCLEQDSSASRKKVHQFAGRLGVEHFETSIDGWAEIIRRVDTPDLIWSTSLRLKVFQDRCLRVAEVLKREGTLHGVGPWLFCAPFKIVLAHRKTLWDDAKADDIFMPLGIEVIRGMNRLIGSGSRFVENIDASMINEEEGGLLEGLGTVSIVQSVCREIARVSNSRVIHINSGLYLYGKKELE